MYYLSKFCRICIQTGTKLLDLESLDYDSVKISEKLLACSKMVVGRESLSTEICVECVKKLRISYQFQNMCRNSSKILEGYLTELIGEEKIDPNNFINTELSVYVTPLPGYGPQSKRKRITKEKRCSLLKQLLTTKSPCKEPRSDQPENCLKGGLKSIINFTRNFEFNYNLDKSKELSPLDKLTQFSNEFFEGNFTEFQDTVLCIIDSKDGFEESDEEDLFKPLEESDEDEDHNEIKFEEVIVEPDVKIKLEPDMDEDCDEVQIKKEMEESIPSDFLQISYKLHDNMTEPNGNTMQLLDRWVGSYPVSMVSLDRSRFFSPSNLRCRTRENPYINPRLKEQFLYKSFKCDKCNRYFKSPGYLKAHNSKIHI